MARPPASDAPPTAERILEAAEEAFAARGLAATRLEDIAAAVGIRRPSLLHHHPTKDALYEAVVRRAFAALGAALAPALVADDYEVSVETLVAAYLHFIAQRPTFAPLVLREVIDDRGPGRALVLEAVLPLLEAVETFVAGRRGRGSRPAVPVRAAILQVACAPLVRSAWGPLGARLWGRGPDATPALARALLLPEKR